MLLSMYRFNILVNEIRTIKKKSNNLLERQRELGSINNIINWRD